MYINKLKNDLNSIIMTDKSYQKEIEFLEKLYEKNCRILPEDFPKYQIKRGLRNSNGTGVLVGLTKVAAVNGYSLIDGNKIPAEGNLTYRGYKLTELIDKYISEDRFGFEEVTYLLMFGQMPDKQDLSDFNNILNKFRNFNDFPSEDIFFRLPSSNVMNKIQRVILSMYTFDDMADDISIENVIKQELDIIAKMPLIISYALVSYEYHYLNKSLIIHRPKLEYSTAQNILHLIRDDSNFSDLEAKVLDLVLIVQAEHGGGNNSTFAIHVVSSTGTDTYSALSTAVGSLKGPKHGGANEQVCKMINFIKDKLNGSYSDDKLEDLLWQMITKQEYDKSGLIYGMGHAVYTITDPRAELLKFHAEKLACEKGLQDDFNLITKVESITKKLFKRKYGEDAVICANVDLYTGIIYQMLNIPVQLYTPLFALARMSGWAAHRLEQISDDKIMRPGYMTIPYKINKEEK